MMTRSILPFLLAIACLTPPARAGAPAAGAPPPFGALPTPSQVAWQRLEYYGFVHFGLNTWTDREWGYGDEDPKLFNPTAFDARAIVRHFKQAGMTGMILTAKHHDGFCLWPTRTTGHNISKSPWLNGKGDVVRAFATACKQEGIKLGIYVSPWDRNNPEYAKPGYVLTFHEQIREVLTNYGPIFEIWFDGANGGDGYYGGAKEKRTIPENYYDFPRIVAMVRGLQPNCIVWGAGTVGDARWGGSEQGHVGYPHWHTLDSKRGFEGATGFRGGDRWVPAEGDTSIRHGWFWHEREDKAVKTPEKLLQVWMDCVGRGANLILNVPPDRDGKIRQPDVDALMGFKALRDGIFAADLAATATASGPARGAGRKFAPVNLVDGNIESYWTTEDGQRAEAELRWPAPVTFSILRLREQIRLGQRVDGFAIDAWIDGAWKEVHGGKSIGNQVLVKLASPLTTDRLRLRITASAAVPCISEFGVFRMPVTLSAPEIVRAADGAATIQAPGGGTLLYTLDGNEPGTGSSVAAGPIAMPLGGTIKARVANGQALGPVTTRVFGVAKAKWKITSATNGNAAAAIDDNPATLWNTHPYSGELAPPQGFTVDFGTALAVSAITYLPRQDGTAHGMTDRYRFELSEDGMTWRTCAEGEFSNLRANPIEQLVPLAQPVTARHLRFTGLRCIEKNHITAAEIGVRVNP